MPLPYSMRDCLPFQVPGKCRVPLSGTVKDRSSSMVGLVKATNNSIVEKKKVSTGSSSRSNPGQTPRLRVRYSRE